MPLSETVLVLMLLLGAGMVVTGLGRRLPVPATVLLVVLGLALSTASRWWEPLAPLQDFRLTPELVLFIFLPALIFESGLNLDARQLVRDLPPVLVLAVPALLISTLAIGFGLWALLPVAVGTALVFGALISATDPVAVIALFKELGTPHRLTVLVEGESLLNDATAIVVVNILVGLALAGAFAWEALGFAAWEFLRVFLGGAAVGVLAGLAFGALLVRLCVGAAGILLLSVVMAYAAFVTAEHLLHLSGVMAVATGAVTLSALALPRLSQEAGGLLRDTWGVLALASNTLLFLLVGLSVDLFTLAGRIDAILIAVALVLAVRAAIVYSLVPLTTRAFRLPRVGAGERHILWWGGLKGGLAIAIALALPADLPERQLILDLTVGVVLFTLLVNATTVRPLIHRLGLDRLGPDEAVELDQTATLARRRAAEVIGRLGSAGLLPPAGAEASRGEVEGAIGETGAGLTAGRHLRRWRLQCLRVEQETLEGLFQAGIVPRYIFLDLRGALQRKRDHLARGPEGTPEADDGPGTNPFLRLERALVRRLRESDRAAGMLARYQRLRVGQHLIKDVAQVLMAEEALAFLAREPRLDAAQRAQLEALYRSRIAALRAGIRDLRDQHPEFYGRFARRLATRAALTRARDTLDEEHRQGGIGAKAHTALASRLDAALRAQPSLSQPLPPPAPRELLAGVPLLAPLPADALDAIAGRVQTVRFLPGDVVIGEGDTGDALYLVAGGRLRVYRGRSPHEALIATLGAGDFFGELALLGDHVRTATVVADQPCTLLRLTRRAVLDIAARHPEVAARLEAARTERDNHDAPTADA